LLAIVTLCGGCQTAPRSLFTASGDGWHVRQGQAVWRPRRGLPELAGDLVVASHQDGRGFVQFAKPPVTLVWAQTTPSRWLIQFPAGHRSFRGHRRRPAHFAWLYLQAALAGEAVPAPLRFERQPAGDWRLENPRSGETLEGFLDP